MKSKTSVVASHARLQQWALQIQECNNRPAGMKVEEWCTLNGMTKANYYYHMQQVRKAYLEQMPDEQIQFVEMAPPVAACSVNVSSTPSATIKLPRGCSIELADSASSEFLCRMIGALFHVE